VDGRFGAGHRGSELRECPRFCSRLFIARGEKRRATCGSSPCINGLGQITRLLIQEGLRKDMTVL
jgi:hypothetical protein